MKNKFCIISSILVVLCTAMNNNCVSSNNNLPSQSFYFTLNNNIVTEDLTETISILDKATNGNIIDMLQNTTNELDDICEYVNNNTNSDLICEMNKYTNVIKKLRKDFRKIRPTLNLKDNLTQEINSSIDSCLLQCKSTLNVIDNKPIIKTTNCLTILDVIKNNKK